MRSPAPLALALVSVVIACLPQRDRNSASDGGRPLSPAVTAVAVAAPVPSPSASSLVLRADNDRGVPLHAVAGDRAVSARLPGGTTVALLASQDGGHWLRVRAPDGTTGWLIDKYVVPAGQGDAAASGELCPLAAPSPDAAFTPADPAGTASLPGKTRRLGASGDLVVVSYNLWELYDGRDGDSYLGEREHPESATLDPAHAARRVAALAAPLARLSADVFVFQEVENAELACAVARAADERSAWRCWASDWAHAERRRRLAPRGHRRAARPGGGHGPTRRPRARR
jgi:hypothetical protein